jgi:hypothetical protein
MTGRHDDRAEDRRELRRLPRRVKDVVDDTVDLLEDVGGIAWTVFDAVEDRVESAVEGRLGRERRRGHRRRPPRPGKSVGHSRADIDGTPLSTDDLEDERPSSSWAGERKDLWVPFLFMRANPGDLGSRPVIGPFWESPDIFIVPGVPPSTAPDVPQQLGQTALAGVDNTVYAHVWNFGHGKASEVIVEFFWCNPALGIGPGSATRIGEAVVSLGARGSHDSHKVVKCPAPWRATFVNGGHECLLVRAWDLPSDTLATPEWDASLNRHIGQRNIHVATAQELTEQPLTLHVGPLYGAPATVRVDRVQPNAMPWLQLHTGARGVFPPGAMPTGDPLLSPPSTIGGGPAGGQAADRHEVDGEGQQVALTTTDQDPVAGEAHVYRVSAQQGGQTVGGYTVVILGT